MAWTLARSARIAAAAGLLLAACLALPAAAQQQRGELRGKLLDPNGRPMIGYRVVLRAKGGAPTIVSQPSGPDGEYSAVAPSGAEFSAIELVGPQGLRLPVAAPLVCKAVTGERCDIHMGAPGTAAAPPPAAATPYAQAPAPTPSPAAAAAEPSGVAAPIPKTVAPPPAPAATPPKPPAPTGAAAPTATKAAAPTGAAPPPATPVPSAVQAPSAPAPPVPAPEPSAAPVPVGGTLIARDGRPLVGYRVVFREQGGAATVLATPAAADGAYTALLPAGKAFQPVAVISPSGKRRDLLDEPPFTPTAGATREIEADVPPPARPLPAPAFPGADRLFLSFVEDAVLVDRYRAEAQLELADYEGSNAIVGRLVGAAQFAGVPQVEWGARIGLGTVDSAFGDESGASDLDVWGKLDLSDPESGHGFAFGFLLTWPTGETARGLGQDAMATKLYAAGRYPLSWGVVTYNAGLRVSEDAHLGGTVLDASVSGSLGGGLVLPLEDRWVGIVELTAETERYDGLGSDIRLLAGFNWLATERLVVRAAAAAGFDDGAPNGQVLAGVSWDF